MIILTPSKVSALQPLEKKKKNLSLLRAAAFPPSSQLQLL